MTYYCPYCERYGMEYDGRAKALACVFNSCRYVISMLGYEPMPSHEEIERVIRRKARPNSALNADLLSVSV